MCQKRLVCGLRDVVGRHAHEEDGGLVGVDVPVHPFRPRLEHLLVRHGAVHLHVLGGALVEGPLPAIFIPFSDTGRIWLTP